MRQPFWSVQLQHTTTSASPPPRSTHRSLMPKVKGQRLQSGFGAGEAHTRIRQHETWQIWGWGKLVHIWDIGKSGDWGKFCKERASLQKGTAVA